MDNSLVIAADDFCKAIYKFCCATIEAIDEVVGQLNEAIETIIEEIESLCKETTETETEHNTVYKSLIHEWMIIFELMKVPIRKTE